MIFMYIFDKQSIIFHVIRICTCVHEAGENKIPAYKQIHETESSRKERNSNLELYRIIVMLLIVAHHYVVNSGLMSVMKEEPLHIQSIFLYLFGMWGKTGINCFVMITGYFMCKSHISLRKFMKLLFEIYFYNLIITGTFLLTGYCSPSFSTVFYALVPIQSFGVNFVACFVVFYLLIPFLNLLIQTMNSKLHLRLILLCLLVYSVIGTIPKITLGVNYVSWFVVLYFIASYIRLYRFPIKISNRNWGWLTLLSILINLIGASTFGVLLIHANSDIMRQWLWQDILNNVGQYGTNTMVLHAILSVIAIFVICILVDMLRMRFVEKPLFNKCVNKL